MGDTQTEDCWLDGAPMLELPTDRQRAVHPPTPGEVVSVTAAPALAAAVHDLAAERGVSPGAVLVGALAEVLSRYTGEHDVVLGLSVPAPVLPGLPVVADSAAVLAVRVDVSADPTVGELVDRASQAVAEASAHQDVPLATLVERVSPGGHHLVHPLFTVCLRVTDTPAAPQADRLCGAAGFAPLDLAVTATLEPTALSLHARYAAELFDRDRVERLLGHLQRVVQAMVADPSARLGRVELLGTAERDRLLSWGTGPRRAVPDTTLPGLVRAQAARTPDRVAVADGTVSLTYRQVVARSGQIANLLRERGAGPGSLVGVCVDRTAGLVPVLLGVLESGAAYVPVDPWYPPERVRFMLTDSGATLVLTTEHLRDRLPTGAGDRLEAVCLDRDRAQVDRQPTDPPRPAPCDEDRAYVIYTSGSTGVPKGVVVRHRGLVNVLTDLTRAPGMTAEDILLAITTPSFDIAAVEFFAPLLVGARTVIAPRECVTDGRLLASTLNSCRASVGQGSPTTWRLLVDAGWQPPRGFRAVSGGEVLPPDLARRLGELGVSVWNGYGPTETTIYSTMYQVTWVNGPIPLGGPIANTDLRVLDPAGRMTPTGVTGELHIGGVGLAEGYLHRPELTAERFVPDPVVAGAMLYRTGDLARWRSDGLLEYLGRADTQVKLRGFRIEPGEVEAVLRAHPGVADAVTVLREDTPGSPRLVAYVTCRGQVDTAVLVGELRARARARLPEYMVPAAVVTLAVLPRTPSGKVDRAALPEPDDAAVEFADYLAPTGDTQRRLAEAFGEVLGLSRVGARDSFFDLGGDSLHAARAVARLQRDLPGLGVRDIYQTPVVADLAAALDAAARDGASRPVPADPPVVSRPVDLARVPLSFQQEQLWFLEELAPGEATYNTVLALRLAGDLDVAVLRRALDTVQARHEVLRTTFVTDGEVPCQVVGPPSPVPLRRDDVGGLPVGEREGAAARLADEEAAQPFDLRHGPLLRARLVRLADTDHLLVVSTHHIVFDGWSEATFTAELAEVYSALRSGRDLRLADLPVQFADFALWQRTWLTGQVLESHLGYWQDRLAGAPTLELPTDRPRPALPSYRGAVLTRQLPPDLLAALRRLARANGVSLFMTLLAGFTVLLSRYSGQEDLVVGTATAGRNRPNCEDLVGFFVNMVVLRSDLSGNPSFTEVLSRVREVTLDAYEHQDVPFEKVVERVAPRRDPSRNPLFQVAFGLLPAPGRAGQFEGLAVTPHVVDPGTARFDLSVNVSETEQGLSLWLEYATDLFDQARMLRLLDHFERVLAAVAAEPSTRVSQVPVLTEPELRQVLVDWQPDARAYRRELVHRLVVEQAGRTPQGVAATFEGRSCSYAELEHRSGLLARHLRALGVGHGDIVGVAVPRGLDVPVCLLGVLRAGAAFVPVDLSHPGERVGFVLSDSQVPVVLSTSGMVGRVPAGPWSTVCVDTVDLAAHADDPLPETATVDSACYVLYTSGSTGRPKGVVIEHHALATYLDFLSTVFDFGPADRMLQFSSLIFDLSEGEIFTALSRGATVVSLSEETMVSPEDLSALLREEQVTYMGAPPAMIGLLDPQGYPDLRGMLVGGEAFSGDLVNRWNTPGRLFLNAYGPTEATIGCTYYPCDRRSWTASPPIGRAMPHRRVYLVDRWLNPVPVGVPGEILATGEGLARGYLNRPGLTAEKFVPNPFGPGRAYHTGDLAYWTEEGQIQFVGRADTQIKLRGQRIELEEIEAILTAHPAVAQAAVVLREDTPGDPRLVGYLVTTGEEPQPAQLREHLAAHLPGYMIPAAYVMLDELPLSPTGKADRAALPAPPTTTAATDHIPPRTSTEQFVADTFADVLRRGRVGAHDDFFLLGGSSLQAAMVLSRTRVHYQVPFSMRDFYANPTVESVAGRVEDAVLAQAASDDLAALLDEALLEEAPEHD